MNILLISPLVTPINSKTKYGGIEKLVWEFANHLRHTHNVAVLGHADSKMPEGVELFPTHFDGEDKFVMAEVKQHQAYSHLIRKYDVVHDFSHSHFASRYMPNLPAINPFWHAPALAKYPKAPYNIVALSRWAAREFKRVYNQESIYKQTITIDPRIYKRSSKLRGERFLTLGIMTPNKGNMEAIMVCKEAGVPLDVVGASSDKEYEQQAKSACDGKVIRFLGEVTHHQKIRLLQACKALLYVTPELYTEVTSHKIQEAMFCGAPVITSSSGAFSEIITHGSNGFLCSSLPDYIEALRNVDKLDIDIEYKNVIEQYSAGNVIQNYLKLYQEVANGKRW